MILYSIYFVLLSIFLLDMGSYFDSAFLAIGVGMGMRTVVIQGLALIVAGLILFSRGIDRIVWRELLGVLVVWTPFILYLAFRVDDHSAYSELKFLKIIAMGFLCVLTVTMTYLCDARTFLHALPIVIIILSVLLGIEAFMHPQQFKYRSDIDRLTLEGMNPIWLARSFAIAGVCLFLLPLRNNMARFLGLGLVVLGILPTGSRGPLISLILTLAVWYAIRSDGAGVRLVITAAVAGVVAISVMLFTEGHIETAVNSYLSRGQNQGFVEESGRPQLFRLATNDFLSSPVVGIGLGAFGRSSGYVSKAFHGRSSSKQGFYPHNIVLEILSELGALGMVLAVIAMRPGKWLLNVRNPYFYLFLLAFLFSMSSGDLNGNIGVIVFATVARLTSEYQFMDEATVDSELPEMDPVT